LDGVEVEVAVVVIVEQGSAGSHDLAEVEFAAGSAAMRKIQLSRRGPVDKRLDHRGVCLNLALRG
jgi:hypothetical protein